MLVYTYNYSSIIGRLTTKKKKKCTFKYSLCITIFMNLFINSVNFLEMGQNVLHNFICFYFENSTLKLIRDDKKCIFYSSTIYQNYDKHYHSLPLKPSVFRPHHIHKNIFKNQAISMKYKENVLAQYLSVMCSG